MNKQAIVTGVLRSGALGIAGIYLILGSAWILFSDKIAARIALNQQMLATIGTYKGGAYVLVTALLLYAMIRRYASALQASEKQLHRVIDAMPAFISYVGADLHYRFTNKTYEEWFGEKKEGKHIEEVLGHTAYQSISKYIEKVLAGETTSYESEFFFQGRERFVTATYVPDTGADGKVKGFFVLGQDRTEQKQAEEEQRLWADAFEGCAHGIAISDPNTNRIVVCNPAFANLHKCRVEGIVGSAILSLYATSDHDHVRRNIERADQIGHAAFEASMIRKGRDGSTFPVQTDVVSVLGEDGELLHRVVTAQDISERKVMDEKLRQSETKYRTLAEHLPAITYISQPDQYVGVSYISPQIESLGFDVQTWLGDPELWFRQIHPDDQEGVTKELQQFQDGAETFRAEYRLILPSGEIRWFHDESNRVKDDAGNTILKQGFMLDITDRKRAETVLQESEERYRIVSELTSDYAYKDRVEEDGSILPEWVTESFTRITGYTWEEAGAPDFWQQLVYPEDLDILLDHIQMLLSGRTHAMELRIITKNGQVRWLKDHANPIWDADQRRVVTLYGAVQDITERKEIEKALQDAHAELELKVQERTAALSEANALLQALMDNIPDHIYFKDRQSRFIRNSRSQAILLGLHDPSETVGKTDFDFFPHAARSYAEEQEIMASGKPLVDFEEWVVWPDGREMWVSTTKMPLWNSEGETLGIFGISRDITDRKRTEQAIRQLNADLEKQAQQLQAANKELEAFSYSVSHDLRAPLRAIDGYTRILLEDYEPLLDSEGKRICGVISREARRMGQLIDDLLAFSRLGRKEMYSSMIDMKALAASVFDELLKEESRAHIYFTLQDLPGIKGDSSLIRQVWVNLLSNAIKFTSKKERAAIELGSQQTNEEIIYYVRDNGAGFDMEYGNKLFGVFQRLHRESEFGGTGVGLAIVQRIIRRHEGRVWAEGEVEKGATFYFALPREENSDERS